jgi:homoserine O-succinyltransferase/O-acetyltransferase
MNIQSRAAPGQGASRWPAWKPPGKGPQLIIGLVNNMPDAALAATERQWHELLAAAAGEAGIRLRLFSLPEVPRGEAGRAHVALNHEPIERLWDADLDALVVTGTEPGPGSLTEEPYWPALARLIDWAEAHTRSTLWSCLAAHAAVLYLDGIERRRLDSKRTGVFDCVRVARHPAWRGLPSRWQVPHSRLNTLPEAPLRRCGYRILSRLCLDDVDTFVRPGRSLFVFLQGHPEYDGSALLREYRRDVRRYLTRVSDRYPDIPRGMLGPSEAAAAEAFRERALGRGDPEFLAEFPLPPEPGSPAGAWQPTSRQLAACWLDWLAEGSGRGIASQQGVAW